MSAAGGGVSEIPAGFLPVGIRLAVREEGGVIRAYLAGTEDMTGAVPVATISLRAVHEDGGREGRLFTEWLECLSLWTNRVSARVTGLPLESFRAFTVEGGIKNGAS